MKYIIDFILKVPFFIVVMLFHLLILLILVIWYFRLTRLGFPKFEIKEYYKSFISSLKDGTSNKIFNG